MNHSRSSKPQLIPLGEALRHVLNRVHPLDAEKIPLAQCLGRVLMENLKVPFDLPPFDRSAMDGYALAGETADGCHRLMGAIPAGASSPPVLHPGECARILTGAPIPNGADRVVIQEECVLEGKQVRVQHPVPTGSNIRRRAEDAKIGDLALAAGQRLGPTHIGIAASLGKAELQVSRCPQVWILSTGTELAEPGQPLQPNQIYNSNAPQLAAQIASFGGDAHLTGSVSDDLAAIAAHIEHALAERADVVCVSGGASVGDADYTRAAFEKCGFTVHFHGVDLKPGKPTLFATREKTLAFGIPGNPVSHLVVFALLIAPTLRALIGLPPAENLKAELGEPWQGKADRRDRWTPAIARQIGSRVELEFLAWKGAGDLIACRAANAAGNIPTGATALAKGVVVAYVPLAG
ncbi:MAG: molybdopterin molybdotransferase MoeA [Verrucomicrobia bacterium]|nr:molybdopterin molybdotransferase MoeA [Verrucomicrobiota bacterium]